MIKLNDVVTILHKFKERIGIGVSVTLDTGLCMFYFKTVSYIIN